jgi:hypothetical protein
LLDKDFVYGFGQLLVERDVTEQSTPAAVVAAPRKRSSSGWSSPDLVDTQY